MSVTVRVAGRGDLATVRQLFSEYVSAPRSETLFQEYLVMQHFEEELKSLPGAYGPPLGALLLAVREAEVLGCVAVKPLELPYVCEMKRLYVRDAARGLGAGRALVLAVLDVARGAGYRVMRLDTLPSMHAAQQLYRACGFYEIAAYNENPIAGTVFMERLF